MLACALLLVAGFAERAVATAGSAQEETAVSIIGPMGLLGFALLLLVVLAAWFLTLRRANTRLRRMEQTCADHEALEDDLRQAQVSVDNAGDMVIWADTEDAHVVYVNQAACDILGYTRTELLGMSVLDFNPARTLENWRSHGQALQDYGPTMAEMTFRRKDGSLLPVESAATLVRHGGVEYSLNIVRDVSKRKALEASLRQAEVGMSNVHDMILWSRVSDRSITYANRAACESLGYAREELIGLDLQRVNPLRTNENWRLICAELRQARQLTFEAVYHRKDGSSFPVEASTTIVVHEGQEYAVGIVRDITTRKAAEGRLQFETRLSRSLAEAASALLGSAPDMSAVAELLLLRACALTGSRQGYVAFVDQQTGGPQPRAMRAMMRAGEGNLDSRPMTFSVEPDGGYRDLWGHRLGTREGYFENDPAERSTVLDLPQSHTGIRPLLFVPAVSKGRLVGQITLANPGRDYTQADLDTVASLADIFALGAEQLLFQHDLLSAKEEAESSSRAKSDFLANMTHEVRTPLNGVLGMLQVLQGTELTPDQKEFAAVALESAERLNQLLGNVIEYARLDASKGESECLLFPVRDLLNALRAVYEPQAVGKGLDFRLEAGADLPDLMRADPQALRQALITLLDNAIKFTPSGHIALAAGLALENNAHLVFRVEDSGVGIPPDKREQVFEAFVQADASATRTYGGAGLGLAIARKLARGLGGAVEALDRPGGGTVMRLTIPVDCGARNNP